MNNPMNKIIKLTAVLCLMLSLSSCKKYLDIEPVGRVIPKTASDFRQLLNAGYSGFAEHKPLLAIRGDEVVLVESDSESANYLDIYKWNDNTPDVISYQFPYLSFYRSIFYTNTVITDIEKNAGKTEETAQLKGEAYLLRAYNYFELLNLYAKNYNPQTAATDRGVPISLEIDLEKKYVPSTVAQVYAQIFSDIEEGKKLLNVTHFEAPNNYRFTSHAAVALTARIHEFRGEWAEALKATQNALAINDKLEDLNTSSLLPNHYKSVENIMSMEEILNSGASKVSVMSSHLIGIYDQANDKRFGMYFSKSDGDYVSAKGNSDALKISFRNGELYLIQAEAALQLDNMSLALKSLMDLKAKRLSPAYFNTEQIRISALNKAGLLQEILNERERELALEGHRWYDLKRYGQPEIKHVLRGITYTLQKNDPRYTIRFPQAAIENNPNLQ